MKTLFLVSFFFFLICSTAFGQTTAEKEKVIQTLEAFQQAIVNSNSEIASKLLAEGARILEGGNIETKKEYLSHHFHADGKFLSAINKEVKSQTVNIEGNVAWVATKSHLWGTYEEQELNLSSLELAVLKKVNGEWKIAALHWSSRSTE